MSVLTSYDIKFIDEMRKVDVLTDIDPEKASLEKGSVFLACADGNQILDKINHAHRLSRQAGACDPTLHMITCNGGPLIFDPQLRLQNLDFCLGEQYDHWKEKMIAGMKKPLLNFEEMVLRCTLQNIKESGVITYYHLAQIQQAMIIKRLKTVTLINHAPCGVADMLGLSVRQIIESHFRSRDFVQLQIPEATVRGQMHICYSNGRRKSYHLNRSAWVQFAEQLADSIQESAVTS